MKLINASLIPVGGKERVSISVTDILLDGTIDRVNKILIKRGVQYDLTSLQWDIVDAPADAKPEVPAAPPVK